MLACHGSFHKDDFLVGKRVGNLLAVRAVVLGAVLAAAAVLVAAILRGVLVRRRGVPAGVLRLAEAISGALGDAVLAIDPAGRILLANSAAARLAGTTVAALVGRDVAELGGELAALARGLERGPATARLSLTLPTRPVRVRAALVRVSSRPPIALAVLRTLPSPVPPPLPARPPPLPARPPPPRPAWPEDGEGRAALAAAAAALRGPLSDAADALSLLRLAAPPLASRAEDALAAAEDAVETARRRVATVATAAQPGAARRPVDVSAMVEELVASFPAPPGVRVRLDPAASRALADERPLRQALRELLAAAATALGGGGEIVVAVRERGGVASVEIAAPAGVAAGGLALARALVVPQGGRVDDGPAVGGGSVVRVALEGAPALAPA